MQSQNNKLKLLIVTPDEAPIHADCDSIRVTLSDDEKGRGGGSYGIRVGHTKTILSLSEGPVTAYQGGACILQRTCSAGFARVEDNVVTVVVEAAEE